MRPEREHTLGYYAGSRWFMGVVTLALIGVFVFWLLSALLEAEELAEKTVVEMTVRNMRTGLQVAMGEAIIGGRDAEIHTWAGSNPLRWLSGPPKDLSAQQIAPWTASNATGMPNGYRGECSRYEATELPDGAWCFEMYSRELVYHPRHKRHLRLLSSGPNDQDKVLRWRVTLPPNAIQQSGGLVGVRVEIVTPYSWLVE